MLKHKERSLDPLRTNKQRLDDIVRTIEDLETPRLQRRTAIKLREKQLNKILINNDEVAAAAE
ncbi:hypothetical protein OB236_17860 [Paenibacillus sp. WQ 127069]|uniref:Uncharacterized protein n=1 Tax=Paenibacillus baimaensis TaxID=2982185 RepID=A0ABT2UH84_9BACL|nr:hypothetical protein [Paenibacillus sp. WQ 127069]MCU6793972.1 hypothetical protein [Paenibacillus sp. WQ 127069]